MATTALGLALQISASTAGLQQSVQDVNKRLDSMVEQSEKTAKGMAVLKTIEIGRALIDGVTALAGALSSAASSAKALFDDARNAIDAVGKLSSQTGVAVETIQSYSRAAGLSGVSIEEMTKALQKMQVNLGKIDEEAKTDPFRDLGLSAERLRESGAQESFEAIADAIAGLATDAEKAAAANEIFGRSGVVLLPLLNQGAEALARQREEAEQLGILSEAEVRSVEAMNDAFSDVGTAIQSIINQVTADLSPVIKEIADQVLEMLKGIGTENIAATITEALFAFADSFLSGLRVLVEVLGQIADGVLALLKDLGVVKESADEQELARIREQATSRRTVTVGGRFSRTQTTFDPTAEQAARIAELEARIAQREEMGTAGLLTAGLDAVRDTLNETREAFANPQAPQETVDATTGVQRAVEDGNNQVVEKLDEVVEAVSPLQPVAL